jgi:ubiquinone/menaquinone biosynthesis C-methylase UbiE
MRPETVKLMCNPYKGEPLIRQGNRLVGIASQQEFIIREGIPVILAEEGRAGRNRGSKLNYDLTAWLYDPIVSLGDRIGLNTELRVRREYIARMQINSGAKVLETAVGTASNLDYLPGEIDFFGLDISFPMLQRAQMKARRANRPVELVQADCGFIPFCDETFDCVFQMGGLQFVSAPFKAISEMARVARPGAVVHIIDEVRGALHTLARMPAHRKYASREKIIDGVKRLVPHGMIDVRSQLIPDTHFYALSFQRPSVPAGRKSVVGI